MAGDPVDDDDAIVDGVHGVIGHICDDLNAGDADDDGGVYHDT